MSIHTHVLAGVHIVDLGAVTRDKFGVVRMAAKVTVQWDV